MIKNLIIKGSEYLLWKTKIIIYWNRLLWDRVISSPDYKYDFYQEDDCFADHLTNFDSPHINNHFKLQNQKWSKQKSVIIHIKRKVYIEPKRGLVLYGKNKFAGFSSIHSYVYPNFIAYYLARWFKEMEHLDQAIYFDGYIGSNYYHFFHDVLNSYWSIVKIENYQKIPVLIGETVWNKHYTQYIIQNTELRKLNWKIIYHKKWLTVSHLIKAYSTDLNWHKTKKLFSSEKNKIPYRKIFLTRPSSHGRFIKNLDELMPILHQYGFEVKDTSILSMEKQIALFRETLILVAIHGSGLTNIIFSQSKYIKVLEIFPKNIKPPHYYWLSGILNISYDTLVGDHQNLKQSFKVNPVFLERKIKKLLYSI